MAKHPTSINAKNKQSSGAPSEPCGHNRECASRGYKDLFVWQCAMRLIAAVYKLTDHFPSDERFGLSSQMRRGAVSIASNIAEGYGRSTTGEFRQFLGNARGAYCELETQIAVARMLGYGSPKSMDETEQMLTSVGRLLHRYMESLGRKYQ